MNDFNLNDEVVWELKRRCSLLMQYAEPGDIGTGMSGSLIRFMAALAPVGYPFEDRYDWMDNEYVKPIMSWETFHSNLYDSLFKKLHQEAYIRVNKGE
jgi:hypothetical protein